MARARTPRVSVLNWMGTLILCSIPGVNLIAIILFLIFAKNPSKRTFAVAGLLLTILCALLCLAAFLFLPDKVAEISNWMRTTASTMP